MRFKYGQKIKPLPYRKEWASVSPYYTRDMLYYVGKVGKIINWEEDYETEKDVYVYKVEFEDKESWWYCEDWLKEYIDFCPDLLDTVKHIRSRKPKKVRVVGFRMGNKTIGIVKRKRKWKTKNSK